MLTKAIRARLDRARASSEPATALEEVARELKTNGMRQYALFRLLCAYQSGLDWNELRSMDDLVDLGWGAPWAPGRPLFDRPLVEEADHAAGDGLYSVHEVIAGLKGLDGRPVRIAGRNWIGFELSALWHMPDSEQRGDESALALGGGVGRWLRLREYQGRPVPGAPPISDIRAVAVWLSEEFGYTPVVVTAFVDARNRGHLGCRPGGIHVVKMTHADGEAPTSRWPN